MNNAKQRVLKFSDNNRLLLVNFNIATSVGIMLDSEVGAIPGLVYVSVDGKDVGAFNEDEFCVSDFDEFTYVFQNDIEAMIDSKNERKQDDT